MCSLLTKIISKLLRIYKDKFVKKNILVIGDSHVQVFKYWLLDLLFYNYKFHVKSVPGATASGLENPNSKTQAYSKFKAALEADDEYYKVVVNLGEVDTGFVIWYRAKKYKESVSNMYQKALDNYMNFINTVNLKYDTIVISTPLPTIEDNNDWGEIANLRSEVETTQIDRTKLTLKYNKSIEVFCNSNGINYVNLDYDSLGENKIVKKTLKNKNSKDHHYDKFNYSMLIYKNLKKIINY